MESPSTNQLHLRRIAGVNAILFFFFWLIILLAGADFPPPVGFLWLVVPATLTFTNANWNTAQPVQVTAVDGQRAEGPEHQVDADLCDEEGGTCLRFTPQNWQTAQTVAVTMAGESAAATAIDHSVVSSDRLYANASADSVRINAPFSGMLFLPVIGR